MNIFLASGTIDFMEMLHKKFSNENMFVMYGAGESILLHETPGKTVFQTPRRYEAICSEGILQQDGFFALNYIPVTEEGRPIFEHLFQTYADQISQFEGCMALRLLRPLHSDTFVVVTQWTSSLFFNQWKTSTNYRQIHSNSENEMMTSSASHIFSSAAYVKTYHGVIEDDENDAKEELE